MEAIDTQQLLTDVTTNIVEDSIRNGWNKIKKFFEDLDAKDAIKYKKAYEKYLNNTNKKIVRLKLLYIDEYQKNYIHFMFV